MPRQIRTALAAVVGCLALSSAFAQTDPAMMSKQESGQSIVDSIPRNLCQPDGVAVGGYDVISYRQDNGPELGAEEFNATFEAAQYWFASDSNLQTFLKNPRRYAPAYNGYCAITLALGRVTCPQYDNFKIEDDRLLLFEVTGFTNGRTLWNSDPEEFRGKADVNFRQILK